jgi:CO/xanthine dehydrogenase FAD-binding subunit
MAASLSSQDFRYVRVRTLPDIVATLRDSLVPLAGGTVLVPKLCRADVDGPGFVDIRGVKTLQGISIQNSTVELGSTTSIAALADSRELHGRGSAIAEAAQCVGNPNVRRMGTIGGNIALRLPTADLIPALLVSEAHVDWLSADGDGSSPIGQVVTDGLPPHSVITRIRMSSAAEAASGFVKFGWRKASAKTIISVAAQLLCTDGVVEDLRLSVAGLSLNTCRLPHTEARSVGQRWTEALLHMLADSAANEPPAQLPGPPSEWYRRRLIQVAVTELLRRIGKGWQ